MKSLETFAQLRHQKSQKGLPPTAGYRVPKWYLNGNRLVAICSREKAKAIPIRRASNPATARNRADPRLRIDLSANGIPFAHLSIARSLFCIFPDYEPSKAPVSFQFR